MLRYKISGKLRYRVGAANLLSATLLHNKAVPYFGTEAFKKGLLRFSRQILASIFLRTVGISRTRHPIFPKQKQKFQASKIASERC